jgi:hypothetical protein
LGRFPRGCDNAEAERKLWDGGKEVLVFWLGAGTWRCWLAGVFVGLRKVNISTGEGVRFWMLETLPTVVSDAVPLT